MRLVLDVLPIMLARSGNVEVIRAMVQLKVEFVVIGGTAMACHGAKAVDEVDDLDLLVSDSMSNAERIVKALRVSQQGTISAAGLARKNIQLQLKRVCWLELLTPPGDARYEDLAVGAVNIAASGMDIAVAGLPALIVLKEIAAAAGGAQEKKHRRDLALLLAQRPAKG